MEKLCGSNAVPRPSKRKKELSLLLKFWRKSWFTHFCRRSWKRYHQKPATAGMENRQTVVLQSHLDMVCQKNNNVDFDFDTQGIEMYVDGDWVKAKEPL